MLKRRRFKQTEALEKRLSKEAEQLRKEARGTPPGIEREQLIKRARQADTASHMSGVADFAWITAAQIKAFRGSLRGREQYR